MCSKITPSLLYHNAASEHINENVRFADLASNSFIRSVEKSWAGKEGLGQGTIVGRYAGHEHQDVQRGVSDSK